MKVFLFIIPLFLFTSLTSYGQESKFKMFKKISCPEKWWVVWHPFAVKKAFNATQEARKVTKEVLQSKLLKGEGNGLQVDAFRHTFWMARLTQEIGWRRAKKLGNAHEKGNYRDFKKQKNEDGVIPDKINSDMDFYNNNVGICIGKKSTKNGLKDIIIETVLQGKCKIIKMNDIGDFLTCDGKIISNDSLKGLWENNKCLVSSNLNY